MNYTKTLIAVAGDCPVQKSAVPEPRGGRATAATLQYELLQGHPYELTQEDVLFECWLHRQEGPARSDAEKAKLWKEFFSKDQPCLRSSPLPKKYGFGLLFDGEGRVALCPMESAEYQRLAGGQSPGVKVLNALRSGRAK